MKTYFVSWSDGSVTALEAENWIDASNRATDMAGEDLRAKCHITGVDVYSPDFLKNLKEGIRQ
jgi:hypothetical protein